MSKDIDFELSERTDEVILSGKDQGRMRSYTKCAPCTNGRHNDCVGEGCECKRNNHKEL